MTPEITNLELMGKYLRRLRYLDTVDPDIREWYQRLREREERERDPHDKEPGVKGAAILYDGAPCSCTPDQICTEHELIEILKEIRARDLRAAS